VVFDFWGSWLVLFYAEPSVRAALCNRHTGHAGFGAVVNTMGGK